MIIVSFISPILALPSQLPRAQSHRNTFGAAFREAADKTNSRIRHDAFETSVMEIQRDDLQRFLELLHSGLVPLT